MKGKYHNNPPPHHMDTSREERRFRKDHLIETPDREWEEGYLLGYIQNQEYLLPKEAYGDWVHSKDSNNLHRGITDVWSWHGW